MSFSKTFKTEHAGDKGSSQKSGHWGTRAEAKLHSRRIRRQRDRHAVDEQLGDRPGPASGA